MADRTSIEPAAAAEKADSAPALLSGGNPQIAKGDGDAPVQAYIAAMPGWKSDVGRRLDGLIVRTVPDVRKAVRWNSPWWGVEGQGWFVSCHVFTRYIKVTFMNGAVAATRAARLGQGQGRALGRRPRGRVRRGARWRSGSGRLPRCPGGRGFEVVVGGGAAAFSRSRV